MVTILVGRVTGASSPPPERLTRRARLVQTIDTILKQLRQRPLLYCWLPLIAWMGIIYWFSSQPRPIDLPTPLLQLLIAKSGHMIGYAGLGLLWWRALAARLSVSARRRLALAFLLTMLYAISDEYHQTFVPGRSGNLIDVLIDAAGAGLAFWQLRRWQNRPDEKSS